MPKYHISSSGRPAVCKAEKRACPLGGRHFENRAEAVSYSITHSKHTAVQFPRSDDPNFIRRQAAIFFEKDERAANRRENEYKKRGLDANDSWAQIRNDYNAGFDTAFRLTATNDEDLAWQTVSLTVDNNSANLDDVMDEHAFRVGFRRGLRVRDGNVKQFLTQPAGDSRFPSHGDNEKHKDLRFLHNPFQEGEKVVIPAGATFTSMDPSLKGRQTKKRAGTYTIHNVFRPYVDGSVGRRSFYPGGLYIAGSGGYWQDISMSPELLAANGKEIFETPVGNESMIKSDLYFRDDDERVQP